MARLSIDIGVNLQDSTRQLGKLNSALININKTADDLAKTLKSLGGINVNPKVNLNQSGGGSAAAPSAPNLKKVDDIFADYNSGVIKAASLTEFLEKKLLDLDNEALRLKQTLSSTQDPAIYNQTLQKLKEVESQTRKTSAAIQAQVPAAANATGGYTRLSQAQERQRQVTNLSNLSLINFGRVAQDLPFGILGIANNLNPLIEGLGQLNTAAKSTGSSLGKELLKSLTGVGGITLAFSAVSAALSFASVGLSYWSRKTKEAKDNTDDFKKELNFAADAIRRLGEEQATYAGSLAGRAVDVKVLKEQLRLGRELTDEEKKRAKIFGITQAIADEESALGALKNTYNELTQQVSQSTLSQGRFLGIIETRGEVDPEKVKAVERAENKRTELAKVREATEKRISKLREELQLTELELSNIEKGIIKDSSKSAEKKEKELTVAEKYALAVAEIRADIVKINEKPFLTFEEKNVAILNRLRSGVDTLADDFPKLFKQDFAKGANGAVSGFLSQINKLDFQTFGDKVRSAFANAQAEAEAIDIAENLLDTDKIGQKISNASSLLKTFYKDQVDLSKKAITFDNLGPATKAWAILSFSIADTSKNLKSLGEQSRSLALDKTFKEYLQDTAALDRRLNALSKNLDSIGKKKLELEIDTDRLRKISSTIDTLIKQGISPIDPRLIFLKLLEAKFKLKVEFDGNSLKEIEEQGKRIAQGLNSAISEILSTIANTLAEGLGKALAGEGTDDLFKEGLKGIANTIKEAGKQLTATAIAVKLFKDNLFKNPALAIAAGIGITILGSFLESKLAFADGGFVSGPGSDRSDSIPARLSNGEFVVQAKSVRKYGRGFMEMLNRGNLPITNNPPSTRFADGGFVSANQIKSSINASDLGAGAFGSGFIAETNISGQDLRLVLKRADSRYSNAT